VKTILHGEKADDHWWSGWPGAYCMKCGADDMDEACIGNSCRCSCHDDFNAAFNAAMTDHSEHGRAYSDGPYRGEPYDPDCSCRATPSQTECGLQGCGFCGVQP